MCLRSKRVTEASSAGIITLATGEHKQTDITLLRQTFYPVTIKVTNAPPGDFVNLEIQDSGGRAMQQGGTRYDAQLQAAHASLPAGRYLLDARVFDVPNNRSPMFGNAEFTVSTAPVTYVSISVLPLRNIPVIIRREFTASASEPTFIPYGDEQGHVLPPLKPEPQSEPRCCGRNILGRELCRWSSAGAGFQRRKRASDRERPPGEVLG